MEDPGNSGNKTGAYGQSTKLERGSGKGTELTVILKAKELSAYILTVTEKSPKRFRFTLTGRLQNNALDVVENLYLANEIYAWDSVQRKERRLELQHFALTRLKLLVYVAQLAMEQKGILYKQFEQISYMAYECQNMIGAWINSDKKRFANRMGEDSR